MKLHNYNSLKFLLMLIVFVPIQAMELEKTSEEINASLIGLIKNKVNTTFTQKPTTLKDALIRILSIARMIETSHLYVGNAEITQAGLVINGHTVPDHIHPMAHPIDEHWCNIMGDRSTVNSIICSHEKTVEASAIILDILHKKVNNENFEICCKTVNSLPFVVGEHIRAQFIAMHPTKKHNIFYDTTGNIQFLHFDKENLFIAGKIDEGIATINMVYPFFPYQYSSSNANEEVFVNALSSSLRLLKARTLHDVSIETVLTPPSFEKRLKKQAERNSRRLSTK